MSNISFSGRVDNIFRKVISLEQVGMMEEGYGLG